MSDRATAPDFAKSGTLISTPHEGGRTSTGDTVSCCHCGRVWLWISGSGRRRGYCQRCHKLTCGNPRCDHCVPQEQQLENMEAGRPILFRPITARVEVAPPKGE